MAERLRQCVMTGARRKRRRPAEKFVKDFHDSTFPHNARRLILGPEAAPGFDVDQDALINRPRIARGAGRRPPPALQISLIWINSRGDQAAYPARSYSSHGEG